MKKWLLCSLLLLSPLLGFEDEELICEDEEFNHYEDVSPFYDTKNTDDLHTKTINPILDYPSKRDDDFLDSLIR